MAPKAGLVTQNSIFNPWNRDDTPAKTDDPSMKNFIHNFLLDYTYI